MINGRPIPFTSKNYSLWHREQLKYIGGSRIGIARNISQVTLTFFAPDKRKTDLTNKAESIMDLMVDAGILEDDNWEIVPKLLLVFGGVDVKNARCDINIA